MSTPTTDPTGLYDLPSGEVARVENTEHSGWTIIVWGSRADHDADAADDVDPTIDWHDRATCSIAGLDLADVAAELGEGATRADESGEVTHAEFVAIADALDATDNMHGPLADDSRARIFAAIDQPGRDTWLAARSAVVGRRGFRTLWQIVAKHVGKPAESREFTPTRRQIINALTGGTP